jgi:hypothetical protein
LQNKDVNKIDLDGMPMLKKGHKVFKSINCQLLVLEDGFEMLLVMVVLSNKGLLYLKAQIKDSNATMLLDSSAINSL